MPPDRRGVTLITGTTVGAVCIQSRHSEMQTHGASAFRMHDAQGRAVGCSEGEQFSRLSSDALDVFCDSFSQVLFKLAQAITEHFLSVKAQP